MDDSKNRDIPILTIASLSLLTFHPTSHNMHPQLAEHLTADLTAGSISATLISPIITIIDRTVAEQTTTKKPLLTTLYTHALSSISKPRQFYLSKPFAIVWSLYASTYIVANSTDTYFRLQPPLADTDSSNENENVIAKAAATLSFLPTYVVNISLGIFKDVKFAQYFSSSSSQNNNPPSTIGAIATTTRTIKPPPPTPSTPTASITPSTTTKLKPSIPLAAYSIFLLRDSITIASSFTLAPWLASSTALLDPVSTNPHIKATIAQLAVPAAFQFVATPLHLLGLDLVGRPGRVGGAGGTSMLERAERVRRDWFSASSVRAVRILPAFGVGCVVNTELREWLLMAYKREARVGERVKV